MQNRTELSEIPVRFEYFKSTGHTRIDLVKLAEETGPLRNWCASD